MAKRTAIILLYCPDRPGIISDVTNFITVNQGNIIYLDQYVDRVENIFFMRIEWQLEKFAIPEEKIEDYFNTLYGQKYQLHFRLYFSDQKPRMAIFVSKMSHCLYDFSHHQQPRRHASCGAKVWHPLFLLAHHQGQQGQARRDRDAIVA